MFWGGWIGLLFGGGLFVGGAVTMTVMSSVVIRWPSLAVSRSTYVPAMLKLAVVSTAVLLPNVTTPEPGAGKLSPGNAQCGG